MNQTEAVREVMEEDPNTRGNSKFAKNLTIIKTMQKMGIPVFVPYKDLNDFSIDALLRIRAGIIREDIRTKVFKLSRPIQEEGVTYEKPENKN